MKKIMLFCLLAVMNIAAAEECSLKFFDNVQLDANGKKVLQTMADKSRMLEDFTYFFIIGEGFINAASVGIKNGRDLAGALNDGTVKFVTPGIQDAAKPILQIDLSLKMNAIQSYLLGHYQVDGVRFPKPKGKWRKLFRDLLDYYTCLRNNL